MPKFDIEGAVFGIAKNIGMLQPSYFQRLLSIREESPVTAARNKLRGGGSCRRGDVWALKDPAVLGMKAFRIGGHCPLQTSFRGVDKRTAEQEKSTCLLSETMIHG